MLKGNPANIRVMRPDDIGRVFEIQQECKLSYWTVSGYAEELSRPDSISLVAESANLILGFLISRLLSDGGKGGKDGFFAEAEILNFGIMEKSRKQGIGRLLINTFVSIACAEQVKVIWLEVRASNQNAIKFYENRGFRQTQRRKNFYTMPAEDAIIMKLLPVPETPAAFPK